jgi:tetratricopeptide (TPR) repeat protein
MRLALLLLLLAPAGDLASAGVSYREGLADLKAGKFEEAVRKFQSALQQEGVEHSEMKYRDSVARRRHAYYPYFGWAEARWAQAQREVELERKHELLQDAIGRLRQTQHPDAAFRMQEVTAALAVVDNQRSAQTGLAGLKGVIAGRVDAKRFEEAIKELEAADKSYPTRTAEIQELRADVLKRQLEAVQGYERALIVFMNDIARTDPILRTESPAAMLKPAFVPVEVHVKPAGPFLWLQGFRDLYEKEAAGVRSAARLDLEALTRITEAFDRSSGDALAAGFLPGFRAARHVAESMRQARLKDIAAGATDAIETETAKSILSSAEVAARTSEALLRTRPATEEITRFIDNDLTAQRLKATELRLAVENAARERQRLTEPILKAEQALAQPETISETAALAQVSKSMKDLGADPQAMTLTDRLRARQFLATAVAEAMIGFLDGESLERVTERCRATAFRAYSLDPKVDAPWRGRLSPKILKVLDRIKPQ